MLHAADRAVVPAEPTLSLSDPSLYINRELSWIAFNRRVLAQAEDSGHPLLERVRFLSIVGSNLDEFFMIRVAALLRKIRSGVEDVSPDGLSTAEQLAQVRTESAEILARQAVCSIDEGLRQRRHGALAMLQVDASMPGRVLDILIENFEIENDCVSRTSDRLGFGDWGQLTALHRPELKYPAFSAPRILSDAEPEALFGAIGRQDQIVHHPFQSFASVEAFLAAAVADPHVVAIKMTLYRIGQDSPLVDMLVEAAEAGKQVAVLVELKARFDERNNIQWARRMEAAGVHVVYGLVNLKTHCKLCLVVRTEGRGIRRYAHVGTGNYNAQTARAYTDIGIFTARPDIVEDVSHVFNYLTGYSNHREYRALLAAPVTLRARLTALIDREAAHAAAGELAVIVIKVNAITDPGVIQALYRASRAGVRIELIVRGVCSLRPGVPGVSDRIRVRSIVGRFLEHSRLFWFENGGEPEVYIGSADLMERNLDRRVEVLCPLDTALAAHVRRVVLELYLGDVRRTRELTSDGQYVRPPGAHGTGPLLDAQQALLEWYQVDARATD